MFESKVATLFTETFLLFETSINLISALNYLTKTNASPTLPAVVNAI